MKRFVALVVLLAVGLVGLPATAEAGTYSGGSLSLTTNNLAVWPDDCGEAPYSVTGSFMNAPDWDVSVSVYDPHGVYADSAYFYASDPVTSDSAYLCGSYDTPGTYRVTAEYETYDSDYNTIEHQTITGYFTFGVRAKQASSLTMNKSKLRAHSWKVVGRVTKAGRAWAGHRVQIQGYVNGSWETLKGKTTDRNGRVVFTSTPERGAGKYPIRLHSSGGSYVRDANSRSFRLTPR